MKIYDAAFCIAVFFILGALAASLKLGFFVVIAAVALAAALFLFTGYFKKSPTFFWLAGLCFFIIIGAFYYLIWGNRQIKNINIVFDKKINFTGIVVKNPERGSQQKLVVESQPPYSGKILAKIQPYPAFDYGDMISFEGTIKRAEPESYANYLAKDGIFGITSYPKIELVAKNRGSNFRAALFKFKEKIILGFQKTLAPEKAAFLSGITMGERAEFSKEFKEAMARSGTTHLVALSGYNISVIVMAMFVFLGYFLGRRYTFILTIAVILGFVLMTGAEASVVRAAIMGFIALLATQVGRLYSVRNAIILAAFFMALINPMVLRFDAGFQLSFVALIGIVYLSPAIKKFFRVPEERDILSFKENFFTTLSAQLAVLPILISNFGAASPVSLLTNILILSVIPLTMSLGFILAGLGFISDYLALIFGWFVGLFLSYETFIIKFFGKLSVFQIDSLNVVFIVLYYFVLIVFIWASKRGTTIIKQRQ